MVLDGNRVRVIINWRKGHPCYKAVKDAADYVHSCPSISWKIELVNNETGHLAELFLSKVLKVQLGFS